MLASLHDALQRRREERRRRWLAGCDHQLDRDDDQCIYCGADPWAGEAATRPGR